MLVSGVGEAMEMEEVEDGRSSGELENWLGEASTGDLNKLVMDYLLVEGYREAAEALGGETGVEEGRSERRESEKSLASRIAVRDAINRGEIASAIHQINEAAPQLLDEDPSLHFRLLQQELLELIRTGRTGEAVEFASSACAEKASEGSGVLEELEKSLALLAFPDPASGPFGGLLEMRQRGEVAGAVNGALLEEEGLRGTPLMASLLQMIHWAQESLDKAEAPYWKLQDPLGPHFAQPKFKTKGSYSVA